MSLLLLILAQCQCSSDGTLDVPGRATFTGVVDLGGPYLLARGPIYYEVGSGVGYHIIDFASGGFRFVGNKGPYESESDFTINSSAQRDAGYILQVGDVGPTEFSVGYDGTTYSKGTRASFVDRSKISGHVSLTCEPNYYTTITGHLPTVADYSWNGTGEVVYYGAPHGDVTIGANNPRDAGMLVQFINPGANHGNVAGIDFAGGFVNQTPHDLADFDQCGLGDRYVISDAGPGTGSSGGEGAPGNRQGDQYQGEAESSMRYARDKHAWYYCNGTAWVPMTRTCL